jgi:hypothetical protein
MLFHAIRSKWIDWVVVGIVVLGLAFIALYTHYKLHEQYIRSHVQYSDDFPRMVVDAMNVGK